MGDRGEIYAVLARLRLGREAAECLLCGGQQLCRLGGDSRELRARGGDAREVGGAALGVEPAEQRRVRAAQPTEPREGHLVRVRVRVRVRVSRVRVRVRVSRVRVSVRVRLRVRYPYP